MRASILRSPNARERAERSFYACYLVTSLDPSKNGKSYVGFTIDPPRRLAQHNGAIANGAKYTMRLRPCDMVLVVSGFNDKVQALQFEWAWQHPESCRATRAFARERNVSDKTSAPAKKAMVMCQMLNTAPWKHMPLTVHCMSDVGERLIEKYADVMPAHVERRRTTTREMEAIVAASANGDEDEFEEEIDDVTRARVMDIGVGETPSASASASLPNGAARTCGADACGKVIRSDRAVGCAACGARFHPVCLARYFFDRAGDEALSWSSQLIPERGPCMRCGKRLTWGAAVSAGTARETVIETTTPQCRGTHDGRKRDADAVTSTEKIRRLRSAERREVERARVRSWAKDVSDVSDDSDDSEDDKRGSDSDVIVE
jgi:structure-specific endonuclease subunit SLX1